MKLNYARRLRKGKTEEPEKPSRMLSALLLALLILAAGFTGTAVDFWKENEEISLEEALRIASNRSGDGYYAIPLEIVRNGAGEKVFVVRIRYDKNGIVANKGAAYVIETGNKDRPVEFTLNKDDAGL